MRWFFGDRVPKEWHESSLRAVSLENTQPQHSARQNARHSTGHTTQHNTQHRRAQHSKARSSAQLQKVQADSRFALILHFGYRRIPLLQSIGTFKYRIGNCFAHSAGPWVASRMYHRFSCYEFCDQRHLDAHRTLPSGLCRLALLGSWPSLVDDNTREIVEQVKQHLGDLGETCSQEASKKRPKIADTSAV